MTPIRQTQVSVNCQQFFFLLNPHADTNNKYWKVLLRIIIELIIGGGASITTVFTAISDGCVRSGFR